MSVFEISMLVCFGISWPLSIFKAVRTKIVEGKSRTFMIIVFLGYVCGVTHKIMYDLDWVVALYVFNGLLVLVDLFLYCHYSKLAQQRTVPEQVRASVAFNGAPVVPVLEASGKCHDALGQRGRH